jgi:hypothetical protein
MNISKEQEPRKDYNQRLQDAAEFNKSHKGDLKNSKYAGCYHCCNIFPAHNVKEWVRSYRRKDEIPDCALCPICGIDAVLPDNKVLLTEEFLKEMCDYWFDYDYED